MKPYTHFTLNERKYLQESLETGDSIRKIAKALRRSPSTISREIKRNWSKKSNHYHHWAAQIKYWERRKSCHRKNNLLKDNAAYAFALEKLHQFWSPEIIAGNWNLNHDKKTSYFVDSLSQAKNLFSLLLKDGDCLLLLNDLPDDYN